MESSLDRRLLSTCVGSSKAGRNQQKEAGGGEEGWTFPMQQMRGFCAPDQGLSRRWVFLCLLTTGIAICALLAVFVVGSGLGSPAGILHRPKKQLARMDSPTVTSKATTIAAGGVTNDHAGTIHEPSEYFDGRHSTSAISTSASFNGKKEGTTGTNQMVMVSEHEEDIEVLAASTISSTVKEPVAEPGEEKRPPHFLYSDPSTRRTATKKDRTDMIPMPPQESAEEVARMLQQEGEETDCVLSQETSFVYRILVELNSLNGTCVGSTAATTNGTLSENDKEQMTNAIVSSFSTLAEQYCDPFVRNVTSAVIVREQFSASAQPPSVTLEVQVLGTLRCRASELGCNVTKIGIFHSPGQVDVQEQQEPTCLCSLANHTDLIATDRGPSEAEFMEHFGVRLATVAPSLDCPGLQAAECGFGTVFQSALEVTFADEDAARNASDLIGPEALRTLNELYGSDDPTICYPEFRVFDSVSVVFQEESVRRQLQDMVTPNASAANVSSPTSLVNGTESSTIVNVTSAPSTSPSSIDGVPSSPQPLTAILYIGGFCSKCGGDLFFQNDVSTRRRLGAASFQDAMEDRPGGRMLQANNTIKSNCFCPIDSVVAEVPGPGIEEFESTLAERLQLEITQTQQVDPESIVVVNDDDSFVNNGIYRYRCTNISSTLKKNVTLELQVTCGSAPELSDEDKNNIGFVYANAYNSLRTTVCDPFNLEVISAKVVETGALRAGGSSSLPLTIEVTVVCYGCDPLATDVYGFPEVFLEEGTTADINNETRYLRRGLQEIEDEGTCTCNSTLPRRSPLEADVTAAFNLISVQEQQDPSLPACIGNASTCDFGKTFTASALLAVQGTLDPLETASILEQAFTNALDRLIGGGNATQCNPLFGLVADTQVYLDFVYNSVDRNTNATARRQLQQDLLPTVAPTADSTFTFSWMSSGSNITDTPTTAPTVQVAGETAFFLLDAYGVCNGCATELIFNSDAVDGRRRLEQTKYEDEISITPPLIELRFLQDVAMEEPESGCYCPIGSVEIVTNFEEISLLEIIQAEVAKITSNLTVTETVSGITRVDCVEQTPFSTTIDFQFSAFEWVVNNPDDVQGLGDVIARIYNGLVEEFCDEYFRSSISLTFVAGSLQRSASTGRRHDRYLQSMQGCLNYRASFAVTGLCRGCQALGTPIPLFGDSITNRKLEELVTRQFTKVSRPRRLQDTGSTCICDSASITQRSAPSRAAIRSGLEALIPDALPWALNPSICGPPVDVEVPCPTIPTGPSTTITLRFYARRSNGGCLNAADLQVMATQYSNTFNSNMQLARFPCELQYLQVSSVIIDPSTLGGCRRELLRGSNRNDEGESQSDITARKLLQDFSPISASMTVTGNIYAANIDAILASEGSELRRAAANIEQTSGGLYEIITGRATSTPSAIPSGFPSDFPSAFPSEFPSDEPSKSPSAQCPTLVDSCTGPTGVVIPWCAGECCVDGPLPSKQIPGPPCDWGGAATIFKGSCKGFKACSFAPSFTSITVGAGSCIGQYACNNKDSNGFAVATSSISIGTNSCLGENACIQLAQLKGDKVSIGENSCHGIFSCSGLGLFEATIVSVGANSCDGENSFDGACQSIGNFAATSVSIGTGSCNGADACNAVGYVNAISVTIGDGSCTGDNSCEELGVLNALSVKVVKSSCDRSACGGTCSPFDPAAKVTCNGCVCT